MEKQATVPLIAIKDLCKYFPLHRALLGPTGGFIRAVDGVSFSIAQGEVLGLAGESGSGKSTVGRVLSGLYHPTSGEVRFRDRALFPSKDGWRPVRKDIQMVFQDPGSSLNPRRTVGKTLEVPLRLHQPDRSRRYEERIAELLAMVELPPDFAEKLPRSMSGGQRQRVVIARALACRPSFVVLDEPTSALDVSVQAKIIRLLLRLQEQFGLAYLFISHDLGLMRNVADRTAVMYLGKIVELASTERLFAQPLHPYTQLLLSSIPVVSAEEEAVRPKTVTVEGEVPSPVDIPRGCSFSSRCPSASAECREEDPAPVEMAEGAPEPETSMPAALRLAILRDGVTIGLLALALLVLLGSFGYVSARFPDLPELMPLHFNYAGEPDLIGPPRDAFRMPIIGLLILGANGLVAAALHQWRRDAGRISAAATVFVQLVMLVAVLRVVH